MFNSKLIKVLSLTFIFKLMALGILLIPWAASASNRQAVQQDAECMVCLSSAQELNAAHHRLTNCCKQFICKKDADALESQAQANHRQNNGEQHARCPHCRHYPLAVVVPVQQRPAAPTPSAPPAQRRQAQPQASAPVRADINERPRRINSQEADQQLKIWLALQANAKNCPTPGCSYAFINERAASPHTFMCPQCHCDYCSHCLIAHDSIISCACAMRRLMRLVNSQLDHAHAQAAVAHQQHMHQPAAAAQAPQVALTARAYALLMKLPGQVQNFQSTFQSMLSRVRMYLNHQ